MNHNLNNVKVNETVCLDKGRSTESIVVVQSLSPNQLFAIIHPVGHSNDTWNVMTNRLTKI